MPLDVAVYTLKGNSRSRIIAPFLAAGIERCGDRVRRYMDSDYRGIDHHDEQVAVFYGYEGRLPRVMEEYKAAGRKVVYLDLGYWGRREGGQHAGFHKVSINARHPTAYFQKNRPPDRIKRFGLNPLPFRRSGDYILLAGMSDRAAASIGLGPEEWERSAVAAIRKWSDRKIVYRPKPSWKGASTLAGCFRGNPKEPIERALRGAWAVVTHHSNVAVDGLIAGVPAFCFDGVAVPMGSQELIDIENPTYPNDRKQWLADIAYCQWNADEMRSGKMWRVLKKDGLIP